MSTTSAPVDAKLTYNHHRSSSIYLDEIAPVISAVNLTSYLKSILYAPRCLLILCLTNFFSWMSLVCYSLYFTDFVGQSIFGGDPTAPNNAPAYIVYEDGVRYGSFGMALYSISCSGYSLILERLVNKFGKFISGHLLHAH